MGACANILITDSTLDNNEAGRSGGGAWVDLPTLVASVSNSTISGNRAAQDGGGLKLRNDGGAFTIDQSTISTNSADTDGGGLSIDNATDGAVVVRRSTITQNVSNADNNSSGVGGGVFVFQGAVTFDHSIVAGNHDYSHAAPDVAGIVNTNRSLIGTGANFLGPLADNGGRTMTHALLNGSPAINAGDSAAVAGVNGVPMTDQRCAVHASLRWSNRYRRVRISAG